MNILPLSTSLKQYLIVTGNYWVFTLTDGALRMLVLMHFYDLGYSAIDIAMLFLFYEIFGVVTNLFGGWLGAKIGLNHTMNMGLCIQILALLALLVPSHWLTLFWVMSAQALSGIAKDLNKMSAKSAIKVLLPNKNNQSNIDTENKLYRWVALLTGSKNSVKGLGFFLGAALLSWLGFRGAILIMVSMLSVALIFSLFNLTQQLGKAKTTPKFTDIFSKSRQINILSAARLFLFASRDVWFVVALPVYLAVEFNWSHWQIGAFIALWIIGYGIVQTLAPKIRFNHTHAINKRRNLVFWSLILALIPAIMAYIIWINSQFFYDYFGMILLTSFFIFGVVFAINSSLHSYVIISYANDDGVSLDVGFYYMANAFGRLFGTVLSGVVFQMWGMAMCLLLSAIMLIITTLISTKLPH